MQYVTRTIQSIMWAKRKQDKATARDISADVLKIKEFYRATIGTNYATATRQSNDNLMSVDMSDWGGRAYPRTNAPFAQ